MTWILDVARRVHAAAAEAALLPTGTKNAVLKDMAARIECDARLVQQANEEDLAAARDAGLGDAKLRRLALPDATLAQMCAGLRLIAELPDPVGRITREYTVPSGLLVRKVRSPLGVILMVYEARPSVTVDAFALCLKSGNACLLKGGREAARTNGALAERIRAALTACHVSPDVAGFLTTSDRDVMEKLLTLDQYIDLVIPRGGAELVRFVGEHARMPVLRHFQGVCHIFVDASADLDSALEICAIAKTSAPATCNAVEAVLVHRDIADEFVTKLTARYRHEGVEVRGDPSVCALAQEAVPATDDDWGREFLDLIVAVKVVPDIEAAIGHIRQYGSNHTDAILTTSEDHAKLFTDRVGSSCTLVNASTRFNDGFQLGLGAEIGISTSRLHAYGPMGLEELTTQRYVVRGTGQAR